MGRPWCRFITKNGNLLSNERITLVNLSLDPAGLGFFIFTNPKCPKFALGALGIVSGGEGRRKRYYDYLTPICYEVNKISFDKREIFRGKKKAISYRKEIFWQ